MATNTVVDELWLARSSGPPGRYHFTMTDPNYQSGTYANWTFQALCSPEGPFIMPSVKNGGTNPYWSREPIGAMENSPLGSLCLDCLEALFS